MQGRLISSSYKLPCDNAMRENPHPIRFTDLAGDVAGEGLEGLTRQLAERLGLLPDASGRGADDGRDLLLTQNIRLPLKMEITWLVSCKDYSTSNASVTEADLPLTAFEAKMRQHKAQGFLLVTTTVISTAAKRLLDGFAADGKFFTDVWDGVRLREMLMHPINDDIFKQFLPASYQRVRALDGVSQDPIERVVEKFKFVTDRLSRVLLIPGIPVPLERSETGQIEELLSAKRPVLLVGEPGTGKSGIGAALCTPLRNPDLPVLFLDARKYNQISDPTDLSRRMALHDAVGHSMERLGRRTGCRLIIDQLDNMAWVHAGQIFVDLAIECARLPGAEVVVLSRRRESSERKLLNRLKSAGFEELECNPIGEAATRDALRRIGIESPSVEVIGLAENLLNLSLVASMKQQEPTYDFSTIRDETVLWERYLDVLKASEMLAGSDHHFGEQVVVEAIQYAEESFQSSDGTFSGQNTSAYHRCLESWLIIVNDAGDRYRFFHEKMQDFLYALGAVKKGLMAPDVARAIGSTKTLTIILIMKRLYPHHRRQEYEEFLRSTFHNV